MSLVKRIKHSSRGKDKGFAWQIELELPSLEGGKNIDALRIAQVAATEIIDRIRANWRRGLKVDNTPSRKTETAEIRRKIKLAALQTADYDDFRSRVIARVGGGTSFPWQYVPSVAKWKDYKKWVTRQQTGVAPDGEIGKKRIKTNYTPDADSPAINASGLMADSLRGKARNGRSWTHNGVRMQASTHVEMRIPKKRQRAAGFVGGLSQGGIDKKTQTFQDMPMTEEILNNAMYWDNMGKRSTDMLAALRVTIMIARFLWRM